VSKLEKVAHIVGKSVFRDLREGFGGGLSGKDTDEDVKFALGVAKNRAGELAVLVFETKYASTLMHEGLIARAYDEQEAANVPPHIRRIAATLAVRCYAGLRMQRPDFERWAWLLCARRSSVEAVVNACTGWLDSRCGDATREFLKALGEGRIEKAKRESERKKKLAAAA